MKASGTLVASVLAASTVALGGSTSSSAGDRDFVLHPSPNEGYASSSVRRSLPMSHTTSEKEKFAPRFDGLKFIETLVTAHR